MRMRAATIVMMLAALILVTCLPSPVVAQTRPSVATDQPLYTLRDKQILLQGDGYTPETDYVVWLQTPIDNSTRLTDLSFTTTEKGQMPPAISLAIDPNSPLGTYLVSVSNSTKMDAAIARAHYGIWGTDKYVYQRTEAIQAFGGGVLPKTSLKVTIRDPTAAFVYDSTIAANETGTFVATWKIPSDAVTESYTIFIDGVGTYDSPNAEFVSLSKFSVTKASLNVTIHVQPNTSYERMQVASAEFVIRYPDSSEVMSIKDGLKPVALYAGQIKLQDIGLAVSGTTSGIWIAQFTIPVNASLGVGYNFLLPANAFDDGKGNIGPEKDVATSGFEATPVTLVVTSDLNATRYQVPLDKLVAYTQISYPDGTPVANATVRAWLDALGSRVNVTITHKRTSSVWVITYPFSWGDLLRLGSWRLQVNATDMYGNTGSESQEVTVEPYTLLEIAIAAVVVLFVVRWLLSRFWRRLYLRTKRAAAWIRTRLRPASVDRYFTNSPVTPWIRSSLSLPKYLYLKT
jgi:hypothetical protein